MSAGGLALRMADQGWRGLLPLLPHDAIPNVRLGADKAALVEKGRGKAPGTWAKAGWSLLHDWRGHPDDADMVENWTRWPGTNVGLRACRAAPWVAFLDVDVLHHEAAATILEMLRRRLSHGEFMWRVGLAPKFLVPVQVTEPVNRARSTVVELDGQRHMVELLGQGQQAVVAGIHPRTGRAYAWPAGGLEDTEPHKLPLLTPDELGEILRACSTVLLRYGKAVGRKGRSQRADNINSTAATASAVERRPVTDLRAKDLPLALAAAEFVHNNDWSYDDWVAWAYALRGAFGNDGWPIWLRFAKQYRKYDEAGTGRRRARGAVRASLATSQVCVSAQFRACGRVTVWPMAPQPHEERQGPDRTKFLNLQGLAQLWAKEEQRYQQGRTMSPLFLRHSGEPSRAGQGA